MTKEICIGGMVTRSRSDFGEVYRGFGDMYRGPVQTLDIGIGDGIYEVVLMGGSPIEADDQVKLYFAGSVPDDPDDNPAGSRERTAEEILGSRVLKPIRIEKIKLGKVSHEHAGILPYG